eukprot:TRINITY_DN29963_c0_g1_i1.p1 TRINITY_DN29963_c0_g1~~TRINITY_DN29963_c0_g1_i1.p1  ORF type:complete len:220 (+),score=26.34 TRINITY_DN29963_c0_g1_i1:166-825(+)
MSVYIKVDEEVLNSNTDVQRSAQVSTAKLLALAFGLPVAIFAFVSAGGSHQTHDASPLEEAHVNLKEVSAQPMSKAVLRHVPPVIESFFRVQNEGACDEFAALFEDRFSVEDPAGSPPVSTKSALRAGCEGSGAVFLSVSLKPTAQYVREVDGKVFVPWHCTSVARNPNGGPPCQMNFFGEDVFTLSDDETRITSEKGHFDASIPAEQMKRCMPSVEHS